MTVRQGRLRPGPEMNGDFWVCVIPETGLNDQEVKRFRQPCFDLLCQFFPGGGFQIVEGAGTSLSGHCGQRSQQIGDLIAQSFCITNPGCQEIRNPKCSCGRKPALAAGRDDGVKQTVKENAFFVRPQIRWFATHACYSANPLVSQISAACMARPEVDSARERTPVRNRAESVENAATPRWWTLRFEAKSVAYTVKFH